VPNVLNGHDDEYEPFWYFQLIGFRLCEITELITLETSLILQQLRTLLLVDKSDQLPLNDGKQEDDQVV
jgi:hypothetical protein